MVLSMVLYMVLSDTLADRCMARRQQVRWKGCFTFTYLWLATKTDIILCLLSNSAGARRGRIGQGNAL